MNCGFCGSTHQVTVLGLKNGYNLDRKVDVICCHNCKDLLTELAIRLSLYATTE